MIQELETEFEGSGECKGFNFTQIAATEKGYVYQVKSNEIKYYEVFHRRTTPICIDFKNRIYSKTDFKVIYPKAKNFGVWAWTFKHKDKALNYIRNLSVCTPSNDNGSQKGKQIYI